MNNPIDRKRHPACRRAGAAVLVMAAMLTAAQSATAAATKAPTTTKVATTKVAKPTTTPTLKNPLPVMKVTDVATGKSVPLASYIDGKKPTLVWFWAPH